MSAWGLEASKGGGWRAGKVSNFVQAGKREAASGKRDGKEGG